MTDLQFTLLVIVLTPVAWLLSLIVMATLGILWDALSYRFRIWRIYQTYRRGL